MQVSEIIKVVAPDTFERPIYAGNAIQTVKSKDAKKVITVRTSTFAAAGEGGSAPVENAAAAADPGLSSFVGEEVAKSDRPELTSAKIIVSGGRAMNHFDYRNGVLHAEAVNLIELADAVGTPFYCYSTATLERHYRVFSEAFAGEKALICYAMIDRLERLSRSGDKDAAKQLLEQLQQMLENLQMAQPGQGDNDMVDQWRDDAAPAIGICQIRRRRSAGAPGCRRARIDRRCFGTTDCVSAP